MRIGHRWAVACAVALLLGAACSPVGAAAGDDHQPRATARHGNIRSLALTDATIIPPRSSPAGDGAAADLSIGNQADQDGEDTTSPTDGGSEPLGETEDEAAARGTIVTHVIGDEITAFELPDTASEPVSSFSNPTEHGGPLVFQALGPAVDGWIEVLLPVRPNGTTGWVEAASVEQTINPYRIEIDASEYELKIYRFDELTLSTTVAIGTGSTPTPLGRFYLIELLRPRNQSGPYGTYAYGLSGHSDTLDSFNGGDGGIGIHGTNQPGLLGQDVSHGCIRVDNPTIEEMAEFLPLGTPVHIFRSADDGADDQGVGSDSSDDEADQ